MSSATKRIPDREGLEFENHGATTDFQRDFDEISAVPKSAQSYGNSHNRYAEASIGRGILKLASSLGFAFIMLAAIYYAVGGFSSGSVSTSGTPTTTPSEIPEVPPVTPRPTGQTNGNSVPSQVPSNP